MHFHWYRVEENDDFIDIATSTIFTGEDDPKYFDGEHKGEEAP